MSSHSFKIDLFCLFLICFTVIFYHIIGTALTVHDKKSVIIPVSQGRLFISLEKYSEQISSVSWDSPDRTPVALCLMVQRQCSLKAGFGAKCSQKATRFAQVTVDSKSLPPIFFISSPKLNHGNQIALVLNLSQDAWKAMLIFIQANANTEQRQVQWDAR